MYAKSLVIGGIVVARTKTSGIWTVSTSLERHERLRTSQIEVANAGGDVTLPSGLQSLSFGELDVWRLPTELAECDSLPRRPWLVAEGPG